MNRDSGILVAPAPVIVLLAVDCEAVKANKASTGLGLNIGGQRPNRFGTFQLSVYSGLGAGALKPLT